MVGTNTSTFSDALLRTYDTAHVFQLEQLGSEIWHKIEESANKIFGGESMRFPVRVAGNQSVRFGTENGQLPTAGAETLLQAVVTPVPLFATARWSNMVAAQSATPKLAFVRAASDAIEFAGKRAYKYLDGAFFRDGTGLLGLVNEASPSGATTTVDGGNIQWFDNGMFVEYFSGGSRVAGPVEVTDVDPINLTITTATDVSSLLTDNDSIYKAGTHAPTNVTNAEVLGVQAGLAATGTYLGISRATNRVWQGQVLDAGGSEIDEDRIYQIEERIQTQAGEGDLGNLTPVSHPAQFRKLFKLINSRRQFTGASADAKAAVTWDGKEIIYSYNCPRAEFLSLDFDNIKRFTLPGGDMQLDNTGGSVVKWVNNYDASFAYWKLYCQLAFCAPNTAGRIHNLATPAA